MSHKAWSKDIINRAREAYNYYKEEYLKVGFTTEIGEAIWPLYYAAHRFDALELFKTSISSIPNNGNYCEIGSANGGSLLLVYLALKSIGKKANLVTIDYRLHLPLVEVLKTTKATLIFGLSQEVHTYILDNSLDLLLIDGGHEYEQVLSDITNYLPKVKIGGTVLLHDFDWLDNGNNKESHTGVVRAVLELTEPYEVTRLRYSSYLKFIKV